MMQPPRHIRATPPLLIFQPDSCAMRPHQGEALGVGDDLAGVEGHLDVVDELLAVAGELRLGGPCRTFAAATRSSFWADRQRAKTASAISVSGTPRSVAEPTVHLPVPFCPAASRIRSTSGLPVSGSLVAEDVAR